MTTKHCLLVCVMPMRQITVEGWRMKACTDSSKLKLSRIVGQQAKVVDGLSEAVAPSKYKYETMWQGSKATKNKYNTQVAGQQSDRAQKR
eukprot:1157835-Pelagomonas_calceolata.AAC.2